MATIRGLAIELSIDDSKVARSFSSLKASASSVGKLLGALNKELKFDPNNLNMMVAKQKTLGEAVTLTKNKLADLTRQQEILNEQTERNADWEDSMRKVEAEILQNVQALRRLEDELNKTNQQIKAFGTAGDKLDKWGQSVTAQGQKISEFGTKVQTAGRSVGDLANSFAPISVVAGAAAVSIFKVGKDFEDAFTGVRKTVDGSESDLKRLETAFIQLSKEIPITAVELAGIGEAAGQLGIPQAEILDFTKVMANLGVATNLTSEEAATSLARFANVAGDVTNRSTDYFSRLGSTIVNLGNNTATTEAEITALATGLGAAGKQVGLTEAETLGFSAALSSVGIAAEAGASSFSKAFIKIEQAVVNGGDDLQAFAEIANMSAEDFAQSFKDKPADAIASFITGLGDVQDAGGSTSIVLADLGLNEVRLSKALKSLSANSSLVTDSLRLANEGWEANSALTREAELRYQTTSSQITIAMNKIKAVLIDTFIKLSPEINKFLAMATDGISGFAESLGNLNADQLMFIVKTLLGLAAVTPVLKLVSSGLGVLGGSIKIVGASTQALGNGASYLGQVLMKANDNTREATKIQSLLATALNGTVKTSKQAGAGMIALSKNTTSLSSSLASGASSGGLFVKALAFMTSPAGLATLAIGALAVGVVALAVHLNKSRNELSATEKAMATMVTQLESGESAFISIEKNGVQAFQKGYENLVNTMELMRIGADFGGLDQLASNTADSFQAIANTITEKGKLTTDVLTKMFLESGGIIDETEQNILRNAQTTTASTVADIQAREKRVTEIIANAIAEKRELNAEEQAEVRAHYATLNQIATTQLSVSQTKELLMREQFKAKGIKITSEEFKEYRNIREEARKDNEATLVQEYNDRRTALEEQLRLTQNNATETARIEQELATLQSDYSTKLFDTKTQDLNDFADIQTGLNAKQLAAFIDISRKESEIRGRVSDGYRATLTGDEQAQLASLAKQKEALGVNEADTGAWLEFIRKNGEEYGQIWDALTEQQRTSLEGLTEEQRLQALAELGVIQDGNAQKIQAITDGGNQALIASNQADFAMLEAKIANNEQLTQNEIDRWNAYANIASANIPTLQAIYGEADLAVLAQKQLTNEALSTEEQARWTNYVNQAMTGTAEQQALIAEADAMRIANAVATGVALSTEDQLAWDALNAQASAGIASLSSQEEVANANRIIAKQVSGATLTAEEQTLWNNLVAQNQTGTTAVQAVNDGADAVALASQVATGKQLNANEQATWSQMLATAEANLSKMTNSTQRQQAQAIVDKARTGTSLNAEESSIWQRLNATVDAETNKMENTVDTSTSTIEDTVSNTDIENPMQANMDGFNDATKTGATDAEGKIKETMEQSTKTIQSYKGEFKSAMDANMQELPNAVQKVRGSMRSGIEGAMRSAVDTAGSYRGEFVSVGGYLMDGLASGIRARASAVASEAASAVSNAVAAAKSAGDIRSPSRVMRDQVGVFLSEGIAVGIEKESQSVFDAIKEVVLPSTSLVGQLADNMTNSINVAKVNTASTVQDIKDQWGVLSTLSNTSVLDGSGLSMQSQDLSVTNDFTVELNLNVNGNVNNDTIADVKKMVQEQIKAMTKDIERNIVMSTVKYRGTR